MIDEKSETIARLTKERDELAFSLKHRDELIKPLKSQLSNRDKEIKELRATLSKILSDAQKELDDHTAENGLYDRTTGQTEYGETEDHNCYLGERLEDLELIINPVLKSKEGEEE